jgi:cysteine desulfurase
VDLMSLASHKTYGPKGIGALYVRRKPRVRIEAQMHGGGHERGMRSGTLPTHQIVGMGEAFRIAREEMGTENERIRMLHERLLAGLQTSSRSSSTATWSARAAQPERQLQFRRGRVADHGRQGHRGVVGLGLHLGQPGAQLRAARPGPQRRTGAFQPAHDDRPLHHREGHRLRRATLQDRVAKLRELSPLWEMYKDGVDLSTIQWAAH